MTVLAFVWLGLLIVDFTEGLSPLLASVTWLIWGLFVVHFLLEFALAPQKLSYLRRHWLTAVSLVLPALRSLRVVRALRLVRLSRAARFQGLVRLLASLNRGMAAVARLVHQYAIGYVIAVTTLVLFGGAAGMYQFERPESLREAGFAELADQGAGLQSYGEALWWTGMMLTTMASEYWPKTPQGRILCWLLAMYAFSIFGYITATVASFLIGQREGSQRQERQRTRYEKELARLREEIAGLRQQVTMRGHQSTDST
jgi:voltage-gated potassium channel